jgi:hypothetical protein
MKKEVPPMLPALHATMHRVPARLRPPHEGERFPANLTPKPEGDLRDIGKVGPAKAAPEGRMQEFVLAYYIKRNSWQKNSFQPDLHIAEKEQLLQAEKWKKLQIKSPDPVFESETKTEPVLEWPHREHGTVWGSNERSRT